MRVGAGLEVNVGVGNAVGVGAEDHPQGIANPFGDLYRRDACHEGVGDEGVAEQVKVEPGAGLLDGVL